MAILTTKKECLKSQTKHGTKIGAEFQIKKIELQIKRQDAKINRFCAEAMLFHPLRVKKATND